MTLTIVGDVDQMMYRFTGASPEIMTETIDKWIPEIKTGFLDVNYRSSQRIVEQSAQLITMNYSDEGGPYEQKFMKSTQARPDAPIGQDISFQMYADTKAEAEGVAATILEQMESGYEFGDFYVSSRTRAQLGYLEGVLYRNDVKFINITGGSFWQNYHVANIVGFLKLAHNTRDSDAFQRVYNIASRFHTDRSGDYCHHHWMGKEFISLTKGQYGLMHMAIARNKRYYYGVSDLQETVQGIQAEIAYADKADGPIRWILDNIYNDWLKAKGENVEEDVDSSIQDDIATILDVASQYSVEEFISYVKEMEEAAEKAKQDNNLDGYVVLSTVHRLKGSERKIMIGIGWGEGYDSISLQPRGLLPHTFSLTPPPQFGVLPTSGMARIEDERCIAFVAVTRAKDKVFLTAPKVYRSYVFSPSRFVQELGVELPEEVETDAENGYEEL